MVFLKSLIVAGLVTLSYAGGGPNSPPPTYESSAVIDLIPSNFDKIAISGTPALVEFFAPWCGHCKKLAPVYEQLAHELEFAKDKLVIAKVDADSEKELGKRFGVQGFPTIKFFDGNSDVPEEYNGGRDLESLTEFLYAKTGVQPKKAKAAKSEVVMLTDTTFKTEIGGDKDVLVAFTAPWCGHCKQLAPVWEKVAQDFAAEPNVIIAKVDAEADNSKATAQAQGVSSYPTLKFFPKGKTEPEPFVGGRNEAEIVSFVNMKTGTHRTVGGGLDQTAGTIESLDALVSKFVGGSSIADIKDEVAKAAKDLKENTQGKYAQYYVKVFDKLSKSDKYATKELARLTNILKKGDLVPAKLDEFTSKINILRRFVAEKVEGVKGKDEL